MIGKVLDGSALAALARGNVEAGAWLETAHAMASSLYVPQLAFTEVLTLHPSAAADLDDIRAHPSIMVKAMTPAEQAAVEQLLATAGDGVFDVLAGHVVHVATTRGWPVLTTDPTRLRRLAPDIEINLLRP